MKYVISPLPDTAQARKFSVRSHPPKSESVFSIPRSLLTVWGNPVKDHLNRFMIAYVKKHGWGKEPVVIDAKGTPKNFDQYIASLEKKKA